MARRLTARSVTLAERRAERAALEDKAKAAESKAKSAKTEATRLKYLAEAKRHRYDAQRIRLRAPSTGKRRRKGKDIFTAIGEML